MHVDSVPDDEVVGDLLVGLVIGTLEGGKRAIGKDHPPAVGDARRVALDDSYFARWVGLLDEQPTVQPGGTTAEDDDFGIRTVCVEHLIVLRVGIDP